MGLVITPLERPRRFNPLAQPLEAPQKLGGRDLVWRFDGGDITSDGGALVLKKLEERTGIVRRFAACFTDYRSPQQIEHPLLDLVAQRVFGLALGYEDLNDHDELRRDPMLAVALGKDDVKGEQRGRAQDRGKALAGKSTLNRLELTSPDYVRPAFTPADTGPHNNAEFDMKARATRIGAKFEWPDISKNITVTGQIEADFEGNFSAADNRNVSSIRSNMLSLRLAYGRIDWNVRPNTDIFFEGGQDWTIFGSSAMMNLFETTFYGAYWGNLYERSPQMRLGFVQKLGGSRNFKLSPEFAIMMPSEGNLPATAVTSACNPTVGLVTTCTNPVVNGLASQIGYGERQGADYGKPELESRVVLHFQLDKAPGVVPAQVLWSGFYTGRQATVLASAVPTDTATGANPNFYKTAFPKGVDNTSNGYGNQLALSLPTRWFTLVASGYEGADLRFFFGGETLSNYNQAGGLTATADGFSVDRSSTVVFGTNAYANAVVAPQRSVRGYGGFVQAGFPISRWFHADPKGRNAGWQAYVEYGIDAPNANDFKLAKGINATTGGGPIKDTLKGVTVFYKMNPWVQFGFEEGKYQGYALPNTKGICTTKVAGVPSCTSTDWRSEFGPIFTF